MADTPTAPHRDGGILGAIEWLGNKLPDPVMLFALLAAAVVACSAIGAGAGWSVQPVRPVVSAAGAGDAPKVTLVDAGEPIRAQSILTGDGIYWAVSSAVRNFINFPPLGIVLVCMLGVGVAEKTGLFASVIKLFASIVPSKLLTPTIIFVGMLAHAGGDAGFIVLPPLAAGLYALYGRSPIVGIVVAFAGVGGGFSANLLISPIDAVMAGLTTQGAHVLNPSYTVAVTCNWAFLAASTFVIALVGWGVTAWVIEPRLSRRGPQDGGPPLAGAALGTDRSLSPLERRGLVYATIVTVVLIGVMLAAALIPGGPLHGNAPATAAGVAPPRWTQAIVPMIFLAFLAPGIAFGLTTGAIRSAGDVSRAFTESMASMASAIVLAFFAAQFIEYLKYSNLDRMLAFVGGKALVQSGLRPTPLLVALVVLTAAINVCISSMSAKWSMLSTVLVPMLMIAGISPELTQAAYRIGDSVTNTVTPLNPYILIILIVAQRHQKSMGVGGLIALLVPYAAAFLVAWIALLLIWIAAGVPLGPGGPLWYAPAS